MIIVSPSPPPKSPPAWSRSISDAAASIAASNRVSPSTSRVCIEADRSMSRMVRPPPPPAPSMRGCMTASTSMSSAISCRSSRMFRRRRWNGALARRSSVDVNHSIVLDTTWVERRSFRKYSSSSSGTVAAARRNPDQGVNHVIGRSPAAASTPPAPTRCRSRCGRSDAACPGARSRCAGGRSARRVVPGTHAAGRA